MTAATSCPSIFISYRRDDSAGHAGRLADRLGQRVGPDRVFRDIEDIAAGEDFVACLERKLDECQVVLALIGPRWLAAGAGGRPRLFDEHDWVRREIARALDRGLRVIPLLLQGATMPGRDALPPELQRLARLNALELRESQFERDLDYLIGVLMPADPGARARRIAIAAPLLAVAIGVAYGAYTMWDRTPERAEHHLRERGLTLDTDTFVEQAAQGNEDEVRLFLRTGVDLEAADSEHRLTALQRAVLEGRTGVVRLLLDAGASPDGALPAATRGEDDEIFELLLSEGPTVAGLDDAMSTAAANGEIARMERLLAAGAELDGNDRNAARSAASNAQPAALRWLIEKGARVVGPLGDDGDTLLHLACGASMPDEPEGDPIIETATLLLDAHADPNATRGPGGGSLSTPLLLAASKDRLELVRLLLDRGARPDVPSSVASEGTPLMVAADAGYTAVVALLIDRGAAIDATNDAGRTALMAAAHRNQFETLDLLIRRGADVNRQDQRGLSALMLATDELDEKAVARLLEADADVHARSAGGSTALMRLEAMSIPAGSPSEAQARAVAQRLIARGGRSDSSTAGGPTLQGGGTTLWNSRMSP